MSRRRLKSRVVAVVVLATAAGLAPASAGTERGRLPGLPRLIELLDVTPEPCPDDRDAAAQCGRFAGTFDALKSDLELVLRRTDMSGIRPDGAWSRSGGTYRRALRDGSGSVEIVFDPAAGRLRFLGADVEAPAPGGIVAGPRIAPSGRVGEPEYDVPERGVAPERLEATVVAPPVPELARIDRVGGRVVVGGRVATDGRPVGLAVLEAEPRGYRFEEAALDAVANWRFEPGAANGAPAPIDFRVVVEFPQ